MKETPCRLGPIIMMAITILFLKSAVAEAKMLVKSPAFEYSQSIPIQYTCQGEDVNPALKIIYPGLEDSPLNLKEIKSFALIVDDPDAPMGTWVHWVVFNIPVGDELTLTIAENSIPGIQGKNSFGKLNYGGPCPPSGTHHYFFKVYALDSMLNLSEGVTKDELLEAMEGHLIFPRPGELIGLYKKVPKK